MKEVMKIICIFGTQIEEVFLLVQNFFLIYSTNFEIIDASF